MVCHLALLLVQFVQNKHAVEAFKTVKDHENLTLLVIFRHIHEIVQIVQKLQGTILPLQDMNGLFFR